MLMDSVQKFGKEEEDMAMGRNDDMRNLVDEIMSEAQAHYTCLNTRLRSLENIVENIEDLLEEVLERIFGSTSNSSDTSILSTVVESGFRTICEGHEQMSTSNSSDTSILSTVVESGTTGVLEKEAKKAESSKGQQAGSGSFFNTKTWMDEWARK